MALRMAFSLLVLLFAHAAAAQDTASVKIKVDVDNVLLTVNSDTVAEDSHGSSLTKGAWFILNLPVGDYEFGFNHAGFETQHQSVSLTPNQIVTLDIAFLPPVIPAEPATGAVTVESEPDSATIMVDGRAVESVTPAQLDLAVGERMVEVVGPGFELLSKTVTVDSMHRTIMKYTLRPEPPPELTAESLGLVYDDQLPKINEEKADMLRRQFNSMAETFAIIPLGQGLLASVLLDSDDQGTAHALIISGVVLTAGSYLLGKTLSARKLRNIQSENEEIDSYNARADAHNFEVDQAVNAANKEAMKKYQIDNRGRGRVKVTKE
ncbi:MAG: PEGA domain-containing protein [candidate division Zixibacteria bacterium]|nr:PEGA domain-containing protein [candidate division Zixibacteria bacterium]MDH4032797.1 PEGA domain-containing protein [candidate division Zixibacteria bacterium]